MNTNKKLFWLVGASALTLLILTICFSDFQKTSAATFAQQQKLLPGVTASDNFGSDICINGNTAVVGAPNDNLSRGSAFVFVRVDSSWTQQAVITASDGAVGDSFGQSVSIDGDRIIIGAPNDDGTVAPNQGSAYVFTRTGTTWTQDAKITQTSGATSDGNFGNDVSISGTTVVIGASGYFVGSFTGSVFVYLATGTVWNLQAEISANTGANRQSFDGYGKSVAINANSIIIGSPTRASSDGVSSFSNSGGAYVFFRTGTTWTQQALFSNIRLGAANDQFGTSVAIDGNTVAVGMPFKERLLPITIIFNVGSAFIYTRSGTTWTQQQEINAGSLTGGDFFGRNISLSGNTVVTSAATSDKVWFRSGTSWSQQSSLTSSNSKSVSASGDTALTSSLGFVRAFLRTGTTWAFQEEFTAGEGETFGQFARAVALSEDGKTAVVGMPNGDSDTATDAGKAYVYDFDENSNSWRQSAVLTASDGAFGDDFGVSVSISKDTIVIGAELTGDNRGSAYVFTKTGTTWTQQAKLIASDGADGDRFGFSVDISGNTVAIGAIEANGHLPVDQGSVYVFIRNGTTWFQVQELHASDATGFEFFGNAVSLKGDTLVVGSVLSDVGGNENQGAAYVFRRITGSWLQQQKLFAADGEANNFFGQFLSVDGDRVVIASRTTNNLGAAYVFKQTASTWSLEQKLLDSEGVPNDFGGSAVDIDGDTILVSASADDIVSANDNHGSVRVFVRSNSVWSEAQILTASDGANEDRIGENGLAVSKNTFFVGCPNDSNGALTSQGSAYVFVANSEDFFWNGATSSDWNTGGNWNVGDDPTTFDTVFIPSVSVTNEAGISNADASVNDLFINAGRSLTIATGRTLIVHGDLTLDGTITGGGTLIFKGENFVANNTVSVNEVRFPAGIHKLSGTGLFIPNTITVTADATLQLDSDQTINRLVINAGGLVTSTSARNLTFIGNGAVLTNNGSQSNFDVNNNITVIFAGTQAQSTGAGTFLQCNSLTVNNPSGVTLGQGAIVSQVLSLQSGDLNTGIFSLQMSPAATSTGTGDVVGNVIRTGFTTTNTLSFGNPFNTIRFNSSGTLPTSVTVNLVKSFPPAFSNAVRRNYTITSLGGLNFSATVRLHYQDSELNGNSETTLGLWRRNATTWVNLGASSRNSTDNWVELTGVAAFSPWAISSPAGPTAANVSVGGRVAAANGYGIRNVIVSLIDADGTTRTARTSTFGYYNFDEVPVGTIIVSVASKRFTFADPTQVLSVSENVGDVDFTAIE